MPSPSYYDLLEIRRESTSLEIENAFVREKAKLKSLPADSSAWQRRRQEVEEAFGILSDISAREAYDRQRFHPDVGSAAELDKVEPDTRTVTYIGISPEENALDQAARYKLMLRKAHRTAEGIEIELAPSAWSRTAVAEELRRHVPSSFLRFNASCNSWTVAGTYEAALQKLFLNLDSALQDDGPGERQVFVIPKFNDPPPSLSPDVRPRESQPSNRSEPRRVRWTATINGTSLGIVGVILLIGWNLYVAGSQRQQEAISQEVAVVRPTRTPIPTPTPTPTPVPMPVSFLTTTKYPKVHLRAGPAQSRASLGFLLEGEEFLVTGRTTNGEWLQIVKGDLTGWSAAWTLAVEDRIDELPVFQP